jgi:hypothetical protein
MAPPKLQDCDRVLVVEGYNDLLFYAEVLGHLGKCDGVYIEQFGGKDNFPTKLETFLRPDLLAAKQSIAVIVDADDDPLKSARTLEAVLNRSTQQDVISGRWTAGTPRIGLFVVPGDGATGEIETLVWKSWAADPSNEMAKACIERYRDCMASIDLKPKSSDKGLLGALLAIYNDDDPRLGPGARAKAFDFRRPELKGLMDFLSVL